MGHRKPEPPQFLLVQWKSGRLGTWLIARESEVKGMGGIVIAREFEFVYSFEPYMNGKPNAKGVDEVS